MIDLQKILKNWEEDSVIDGNNLDTSSIESAKLHAKYLQLYSMSKLQLKKNDLEQKVLLRDKWLHYNGKMDEGRINEKGWEYDPLDGLRVLKTDLGRFYDADADIQRSEERLEYWKTVVDTLKDILDSVKWRHQTIKNMIEFKKFQAGV